MANFSSYNFKLNGAQHLKDNGNVIAAALDVTKADGYAAAFAKVIAQAPMTGADVALTPSGDDLLITVNGSLSTQSTPGQLTKTLLFCYLIQ